MPTHVALFRAINVGAHGRVGMADLCAAAARSGLESPRAVLQSGNIVFGSAAASEHFEQRLEAMMARTFGLESAVFVRSASEWHSIVDGLPFADLAEADPAHVLAMPLRAAPDATRIAALDAAVTDPERVAHRGTTAYIAYPDGIGRSKLTPALIERHLGTVGTGRNWRTVLKIASLLGV